MRHNGILFFCTSGLLALALSGQTAKPNFSGKWQAIAEKSELHSGKVSTLTLVVDQKGAAIHIVRTVKAANGKESVTEFNCTTDGKDCDAKGVKVSLWYDGMSLVEMDVGDDLVTKTSMTLGDGAKSIEAGVTYISPPAEADKLVLQKM